MFVDNPLRGGPVQVRSGPVALAGDLALPVDARGLVVFAHGSGSNRRSKRDAHTHEALFGRGLATLRFDLLTTYEEEVDTSSPQFRFDQRLLASRLVDALEWADDQFAATRLPIGLFGSSSGAAAALIAAARRPEHVAAVVARGGRTDLAAQLLGQVIAPTLLIVGSDDAAVRPLNEEALEQLAAPIRELAVIDGAGPLFDEPGMLDKVGRLAADWFERHLSGEARETA